MGLADGVRAGTEWGQSLNTGSSLGSFVKGITERATALGLVRAEARIKSDEEIRSAGPIAEAKAKAESQYDPEKQLFARLMGVQSGGGAAGPSQDPLSGFKLTEIKAGPGTFVGPGAAQVAGERKGIEDDAIRMSRLRSAIPLIRQIEQKASALPVVRTSNDRVKMAPGIMWSNLTQSDPALAEYARFIDTNRPTLARLAGDVGNLALPEQEKAARGVPGGYDRQEVKARLLAGYYEKIIMGAVKDSQNKGGTLTEQQMAEELGGYWDARTRNFNSDSLDLIRAGKQVIYPSKPGGVLEQDDQGNFAYRFPDGTYEELE